MGIVELVLLAIGMSMDVFAVSICKGIETKKATLKQVMICGVWFGCFHFIMPMTGYFLSSFFTVFINKVAPWLAFGLLAFLGVKMIKEAFSGEEDETKPGFNFKTMFPLAVATSIDALAVGVTLVAVPVQVIDATNIVNTVFGCLLIALITFVFACMGVRIGNSFGTRYQAGAEAAGGFILIFIGLKVLLEHLGVIDFMNNSDVLFGLLVPFAGSIIGSALVFVVKKELHESIKLIFTGMAGGIMMACSMWTLLYPAILQGKVYTASIGFIIGIGFQYILDKAIPHTHVFTKVDEGPASKIGHSGRVMLSEMIHHVPEGMAVGVIFAGVLNGSGDVKVAAAAAVTLGIAIQNIPEGAFVSSPLWSGGEEKGKSFLMGVISGVVEPLLGIATIIFVNALPGTHLFIMALTGGAITFLVLEETIPSMHTGDHSDKGTISFAVFFCLMMILTFAVGV
ncbi:MAG: manganese efflux pump [Clostridiales bacterium]|nr:manganese efflux pump [Clostridiales bacterium]